MVRVRTAPSPTGIPHIGNTWAALINFLFARKNKGKFILRLEDTDRTRLILESVNKIFETLHWLGIEYDEGPDIGGPYAPYLQSERLEFYKKYAYELVDKGFAYQEEGAVKFKVIKIGKTAWTDLVGNRAIEFRNLTQDDFVLLKSDGFPTYHLANVVDDHLMKITHVIRGAEWISSTPKHIMIYEALGWDLPQFAHLPLLLGSDRSKLSKRHGAKSVLEFRDEGYLKEALVNFMAKMGWSPPKSEGIISLHEMIAAFDLKDINLASPVFDVTKLDWLNGEYIRMLSDEELTKRLQEFLVNHPAKEKIGPVVPLIKERIKKLSDFVPLTDFLFENPEYEKSLFEKLNIPNYTEVLNKVLEKLESLSKPWKKEDFEKEFQNLAKELNLSNTQMFQLIRVAISGSTVTPPLFESMQILGEEEVIKRIKNGRKY